jgi:NAD(P)-dependent dehydrogenase (short-subunit alcohol dehydrogenase family)
MVAEITSKYPQVGATFVQLDLSSLASVKAAVRRDFKHDRLDILMNNAGIMAQPATLSTDGYEIQFATNHLGHAMLTNCLLPTLLRTANEPNSDVRVIHNSSLGYAFAPSGGILFSELDSKSTIKRSVLGSWVRYGHSKLANILFSHELARRYPQITSVSIHPGVVLTDLYHSQTRGNRFFIYWTCWAQGVKLIEPHQGAWNQTWCAAAAKKGELQSGKFYLPVGAEATETLTKLGKDGKLAKELWDWTEKVLAKF